MVDTDAAHPGTATPVAEAAGANDGAPRSRPAVALRGADHVGGAAGKQRRVPQQSRSRDRVARLLDAAATLVCEEGVDAVNTRSIAARAEIPVASLYQYFADKDEILLALVERDIADMDRQVAEDLAGLTALSVRSIVETTMDAFVKMHVQRPAFVMIWLRGRTNQAIRDYGRRHNRRLAGDLFRLATDAGLIRKDTSPLVAELATEVGDRCFQLAFEETLTGDPAIIAEAKKAVATYLESYATEAGLTGVPV